MSNIDWTKPLRVLYFSEDGRVIGNGGTPAYTYNSHGSRVVWIEDRVYPVDEEGRVKARVDYDECTWVQKGEQIVENVPEEPKDHIRVYCVGDKWHVDRTSTGQLQTKEFWEDPLNGSYEAVVVKVPV